MIRVLFSAVLLFFEGFTASSFVFFGIRAAGFAAAFAFAFEFYKINGYIGIIA